VRAVCQLAVDSGHRARGPIAAHDIGCLLERRGDYEGAKAAWGLAIDSGHPEEAPQALQRVTSGRSRYYLFSSLPLLELPAIVPVRREIAAQPMLPIVACSRARVRA